MTEQPLPIDAAEPMAIQSLHALMIAAEEGLFTYRMPFDARNAGQVEAVRRELGDDVEPPTDGAYYFVYILSKKDGLIPWFIPEGDVRAAVQAFALLHSRAMALRVQYRLRTLPGTSPR